MSTAIVIGAGPAGSTTALLLARRGWAVTLIERHRFPRDKVCGECLSALGIRTLDQIGMAERIRARHHPVELRHANLYGPAGEVARVSLAEPMWGIRRTDLDAELLAAARDAGARVLIPARAESIAAAAGAAADDRPVVRVRHLSDNDLRDLPADRVFLADGKASLCQTRPPPTGDLGVKAHFAGVTAPPRTIGLYALDGHYVGLAPVNGGGWNLAFSAPAARMKEARTPDALLARATHENRALRDHLAAARRVGEWLVSPLPRFPVTRTWPPGVVPVGNAAAALEPIGGEGMGLAIASAAAAVELDAARQDLRRTYRGMWRLRALSGRAVALAVSRPALAGAVVEWAAANEGLARAVMAMMGKRATARAPAPGRDRSPEFTAGTAPG